MVTKASTTAAGKRKKTEEMADSPPKRVTRARTAKATEDVEAPTKTTKAIKPPAKTAVEKKKAPAKVTTTQKKAPASKRKTRADDEAETPIEEPAPEPEVVEESKPKTAASRGSRKKATTLAEETKPEAIDAPKPRGRQAKTVAAEKPAKSTTTTRDRPKKSQIDEEPAVVSEPSEPIKVVKKTQPARGAIKSDVPKATARSRTTKKVQFSEDLDKENVPLETEASKTAGKSTKKSAMKPTGIRAKPVRKAAATRTTTRGRKAANDVAETEKEKLPLSPKKVDQVAKAGSVSSEDELAGETTPIKSPHKSPFKPQDSPVRVPTAPSSPSKPAAANILASPSRRPPPSPFKDALSMSPRKVDINFGNEMPLFQSASNASPAKPSLLQESPRKMKLQTSVLHPALNSSQSPLKASLLQSPARRPLTSPFKSQPKVSNADASTPASPIKLPSPPKALRFSPQQAASSPLRAAKSPSRAMPVHKITPKGQEANPIFKAPSPDMLDSPSKISMDGGASPEAHIDPDVTMQDVEDVQPAFNIKDDAWRRVSMESGSTDELASPDKRFAPTPLRKNNGIASQDFGTPSTSARAGVIEAPNDVSFTPLVSKLGGWAASSPEKGIQMAKSSLNNDAFTTATGQTDTPSSSHSVSPTPSIASGPPHSVSSSRKTRGVFSLGGAAAATLQQETPLKETSPVTRSFFEDEIAAMDNELNDAQEVIDATLNVLSDGEVTQSALKSSMESNASEEYGDENAAPTEAEMLREEQDLTLTCTPAKVFTPAKPILRHQEMHTVSKVPLRASMEHSPVKAIRPRSKSMGGPLSVMESPLPTQPQTPKLQAAIGPQTPSSGMKLDLETPGRTIRKGVVPDVLKGAIVYVDVHTSEGADASGIFVDLLTQMGARCVKQWNWNPRASMAAGPLDNVASPTSESPSGSPSTGRVGITHVVYKDGGKRTLEKVRQSNGVVLCVGVGWVLE